MTATLLLAASAAIILALGLAPLVFTYHGPKLRPRDTSLQTGMARVSPVISRETTMWRAWVGFMPATAWEPSCLAWSTATWP
jgi:hypothetical protein